MAIYLTGEMGGITCSDLGVYFGGVSGALIAAMHKRVSEEAGKDRRFKRRIDKLIRQILII